MSKHTFITMMFSASLFTLIVTDFYHSIPWYVQFGPVILTVIIIFVGALFEKKENETKEIETADEKKKRRKHWFAFIIFIWLVILAMNIFVGEPESNVFNIRKPEFWILIVALPLLSQFNYKKRTDGT